MVLCSGLESETEFVGLGRRVLEVMLQLRDPFCKWSSTGLSGIILNSKPRSFGSRRLAAPTTHTCKSSFRTLRNVPPGLFIGSHETVHGSPSLQAVQYKIM